MKHIKLDKLIYQTTSKVWSHNPHLTSNMKRISMRKDMKIIIHLHWLLLETYEMD